MALRHPGWQQRQYLPRGQWTFGTLHLFGSYIAEIEALTDGECLRWSHHPIPAVLRPEGNFLTVVAVAPRPDTAVPDVIFVPPPYIAPQAAHDWARSILLSDAIIWDTETTGTNVFHAEIVSIAAISAVQYPYNQLLYRHIFVGSVLPLGIHG